MTGIIESLSPGNLGFGHGQGGRMKRLFATGALVGLLFVASPGLAAADDPETTSFSDALAAGKATLALRLRYEDVSDDAVGRDKAEALTLRTVVAYSSSPWRGLSLRLDAEDVRAFNDHYNNAGAGGAGNGVTGRPVVADSEGTALLRANLTRKGERVALGVGRDEIVLGDSRFVGNIGWRQKHQTFDGATLRANPGDRVKLFYGFIEGVEKINRGTDMLDGHLAQAEIDLQAAGKLTFYGFHLDYDTASRRKLSSSTWGAEWKGARSAGNGKLLYELELARQSDAGSNPGRIDADYSFVRLGYQGSRVTVQGGREVLGGSARDGQFNTPLATLHKFNGWADKFLATPTNGLVDSYLQLNGKLRGVAWLAKYHRFEADTGSIDYGSEVDVQLLHKTARGVVLGFKLAFYDADSHGADTEKLIFWTAYSI
jgi:hypothetical protein